MEPLLPSTSSTSSDIHNSQNVAATASIESNIQTETTSAPIIHHTKNLYPFVRHTLLIICVLFSLLLILFLMHQNGKSIYDNGI